MREVNFSIPNGNKASVGITTALYDRRALDCTSTLPLINSLNQLAYLTTSSARIRDILTVDGGVERLVCILKAGRSKDIMEMWKWNLAFQCVVNIGVRGSEDVRTRVVEADVVPVIATILDNYIQVVDKCRKRASQRAAQLAAAATACSTAPTMSAATRSREHRGGASFSNRADRSVPNWESRSFRRQPPPPSIEIPTPLTPLSDPADLTPMDSTPSTAPRSAVTSPPDRTSFSRYQSLETHNFRSLDGRLSLNMPQSAGPSRLPAVAHPIASAVPPIERAESFGLMPVRDVDRLPSMVPGFVPGVASQPQSPTTPHPFALPTRPPAMRPLVDVAVADRGRSGPSMLRRRSTSVDSDDDRNADEIISDAVAGVEVAIEPHVDIQAAVDVEGIDDRESMLESVESHLGFSEVSEGAEADTFNITHRSVVDGSLITHPSVVDGSLIASGPNGHHAHPPRPRIPLAFMPAPRATPLMAAPAIPSANYSVFFLDRPAMSSVLAAMPRDEDVLMCLQLLAYISKYCNLRSYFQNCHLVPRLRIGKELSLLDEDASDSASPTAEEPMAEEYLLPDDFNIFPLVEKFTVRHHSKDMQYWAGVVMRNLCRKDDSRGGIRQCAYYQCGKWEQFARQFAKCRRCRRTKYCSKECQKSAWVYHRHWCVAAQQA
jgi:hypothetical protein